MNWSLFGAYYLIFLTPIFTNLFFDFIQFIKYRSMRKVFVSKTLKTICYVASFIALFAFLSNLIDYIQGNDWFVFMMFSIYLILNFVLIILRNERIVYNKSTGAIICSINFKR